MNGTNATQHRTVQRHTKMHPYDRADRRNVLRYELSIDQLANVGFTPIGTAEDPCDYIGVCHSYCTRIDAQSCSNYPAIYEQWKQIQQKYTKRY